MGKLPDSPNRPGGNPTTPDNTRLEWLGPLAGPLQRFLDAPASSDPFYLTNRTLAQKARLGVLIAIPCLVVGGGIALAITGFFDRPAPPPPTLTPDQIAAKMLPNLDKDVKLPADHDLEVADVHVQPGATPHVAGMVRNNTGHVILDADLFFDLTDSSGSRLGAVSTHIPKIAPNTAIPFSFPVAQKNAAFVLVREVRR